MQAAAVQEYKIDAPFRSPEHAIRWAYRTESRDIVAVGSYLVSMMGGGIKPVSDRRLPRDPHDRHALAAMVLAFIGRTLTLQDHLVIRAKYTVADSKMLVMRKEVDVRLVCDMLVAGLEPREAPAEFLAYAVDSVRGWARMKREHPDQWWANKLDRDVSTLRRWRHGYRVRRDQGFVTRIEGALQNAIGKLFEPMYQAGMTRE